ncbi:Ldh family oxidoreductase [Devosia sp. CAU 1758]
MKVSATEAEELTTALLTTAGAPTAHARLQAKSLVGAELRGHPSHGLQRLPRILDRIERGLADPAARGQLNWRKPGVLHVDGTRGLGPVVAFSTIDALLERVDDTGIALACVGNSNHLGMLALYVEAVAGAGRICIALSTSEALVHPFAGTRAMVGTNPIAIGIPAGEEPFVLDLATSLVSMGKVHDHALRGAPLPEGWALDAEGQPTTDAERAKRGSIAPFGDAKGYGLGLALEVLVASLVGSAFAPDVHGTLDAEHVANKGDVFIVIDPANAQTARIAAYLDAVRASPAADADRPVRVPGDGARRRRLAALGHGFTVNDTLWRSLNDRLDNTSPQLKQELSS